MIGVPCGLAFLQCPALTTLCPCSTTRLRAEVQYNQAGWGDGSVQTGIGFNSCVMLLDYPPYGPVCPWLAVGGLVFTGGEAATGDCQVTSLSGCCTTVWHRGRPTPVPEHAPLPTMLLPALPDAAILMLWNIPGAFLMGCLFTTFISWIRFPETVSNGGLVSHLIRYPRPSRCGTD